MVAIILYIERSNAMHRTSINVTTVRLSDCQPSAYTVRQDGRHMHMKVTGSCMYKNIAV